jgi:hypothetical protein
VDGTSTTFQDDGIIESGSLFGYVFTPSVINEISVIGEELEGPKTVYVTGANVDIFFYDPAFNDLPVDASATRFRVPVAGAIAPNGGRSGFSFEVVPPEVLAAVGARLGAPTATNPIPRTTLDVQIQMVGTRGGNEIVSNVFRYPVEVCVGCLSTDLGACSLLTDSVMPAPGGSCNIVQDGFVDCCDNFAVCPAAPPPAPPPA